MELEGYTNFDKIAEGGMAVLYRAVQESLDREVAIKVLSHHMSEVPGVKDYFEQESRIVARLDHPNIIRVIDRGVTPGGEPFFVMDYVDGTSLSYALKHQQLNFKQKIRITLQLAKALSYAHKNGVIHRDMKPANVLLDKAGNVRIVDFGIAQLVQESALLEGTTACRKLASEGVMGTPNFMAPEQREGGSITPQSDIYALGVIMYLMFTGCLPTENHPPAKQVKDSIPSALSDLIESLLEAQPEQRPESADLIVEFILRASKGAHLNAKQKETARKSLPVREKFSILDLVQDDEFGSLYLVQNLENQKLMVMKKRPVTARGYQESLLLKQLHHPNIIHILGVNRNERIFIVVMEYLKGGSLQNRIARPYALERFKKLALQMAEAVSFAHQNRITHGNLRPQNILFATDEQVKITDFGFDPHYQQCVDGNWYQREGEAFSVQGDVFSLGVIFYQMLTAQIPKWRLGKLIASKQFKRAPQQLTELIENMLLLNPNNRIESMEVVKECLQGMDGSALVDEFDGDESIDLVKKKPKKTRLAWALVVGTLAASLGWFLFGHDVSVFLKNFLN